MINMINNDKSYWYNGYNGINSGWLALVIDNDNDDNY